MAFGKKESESKSTESKSTEEVIESRINALLGDNSSRINQLLDDAEEAIMKAETPGQLNRVRRMSRMKIKMLRSLEFDKDRL